MSEPDYDAEIQPLLDYFLDFEMTELSESIPIEETVYFDNAKYRLQERIPLESVDPNYEILLEFYDEILSDSDTLSNISDPYNSYGAPINNVAMDIKLEDPTEESLKSLLETQFLSTDDNDWDHNASNNEYERILAKKIRKEKYLQQRTSETNEQRMIRLEKRRAYMKSYHAKKKLLQAKKTSLNE